MQPDITDKIILSTVCLHNFLKSCEEQQPATNRVYCPPNFVDNENNGNIIYGAWRNNDIQIQNIAPCNARRATIEAYELRNKLADYFLTPEGEVSWQYECVRRGQTAIYCKRTSSKTKFLTLTFVTIYLLSKRITSDCLVL